MTTDDINARDALLLAAINRPVGDDTWDDDVEALEALFEQAGKDFGYPDIENMTEVSGACAFDVGDVMGFTAKGHFPKLLFAYAVAESGYRDMSLWELEDELHFITHTWGRLVPYSLMYPDEPPCGQGPEAEIWEWSITPRRGFDPITRMEW